MPRVGIGFPELLFYAACLAGCLTLWVSSIGSSLWVDETLSFWQINGGFFEIPRRQWMTFPAYSYLLWFDTKVFGTSEIALRIPSLLAVLGSARIVYLICRELLNDARSAYVGLIFFAAHPFVASAAGDARPYGFALLTTSVAILLALRLRSTNEIRDGVVFGCSCGIIIWFHFLFAVIVPGLFVCFIARLRIRKVVGWRPICAAVAGFIAMTLPAVPELIYTFTSRQAHVISEAPGLLSLVNVALPGFVMLSIPLMIVPAEWLWLARKELARPIYFWLMVGAVPALILFSISTFSSLHVFLARYTLVAVPGLAIGWALLARSSPFRWGNLLLVSILLGLGIVPQLVHKRYDRGHGDLRTALSFAESRAQAVGGPIVLCSQFAEANGSPMPTARDLTKDKLFSPLSYYPVHADVVPLPQLLTDQTLQIGSQFLREAASTRRPFVVFGATASRPVLEWFGQHAKGDFDVQWNDSVGEIYTVAVFTPKAASH